MNAQATYIKYLNKEITENDFAYQVRRNPMLREYVSPTNSITDIISILKGKGVIWEEKSVYEQPKRGFDAFESFKQHMVMGRIKEEKDQKIPKESGKKKPTADDVNYYEFTMGWRWEYMNNPTLRKTQNIEKAREIAVKNIAKDPMYYSQKIYGDTFKKQEDDRVYNVKDLNKHKSPAEQAQLKDKENGMKQVKDQTAKVANVTGGLKKAYIDKGQPQKSKFNKKPNEAPMAVSGKTKATALKEAIKKSVKGILKDPAYETYIKRLRESLEVEPDDIEHHIKKPDGVYHDDDKKDESVVKEPKDLASQLGDLHKGLKKPVKEDEMSRGKFSDSMVDIGVKALMGDGGNKPEALHRIEAMMTKADPQQKEWLEKVKAKIDGGGEEIKEEMSKDLKPKVSPYSSEELSKKKARPDEIMKFNQGFGSHQPVVFLVNPDIKSEYSKRLADFKRMSGSKGSSPFIGKELKAIAKYYRMDKPIIIDLRGFDERKIEDLSTSMPAKGVNEEVNEVERDVLIKALADDYMKRHKGNKRDVLYIIDFDIEAFAKDPKKVDILKKVKEYVEKMPAMPVKYSSKTFSKNEEFQDNTAPEYASEEPSAQIELEDKGVSKAKIHQGKMHKILGVKPGEEIKDKYKTGESLYDALSKKLSDHDKVMKMLNYAANISKEKDVFDAAVRFGKEKK